MANYTINKRTRKNDTVYCLKVRGTMKEVLEELIALLIEKDRSKQIINLKLLLHTRSLLLNKVR